MVSFELDHAPARTGDAYLRLIPRTEMDIAVVGAGARITLDDAGNVASATIAIGAVAPTAAPGDGGRGRPSSATPSTTPTLAAVAEAASAACNPIDDKRGTIAYRRQVAGVLARRAVVAAAERAAARSNGASTNGGSR